MLKRLQGQSFTGGLILTALLGWFFREVPPPISGKLLVEVSVFTIFLLQGWALPANELGRGVLQWRHHGFVLSWNFCWAPLLALPLLLLPPEILPRDMVLGLIFLSFLPTTVSSAAALTGACGGRVSTALFASTSSNLIGILIVPVFAVMLLAATTAEPPPLMPLFIKISLIILLPVLLGQLARVLLRAPAKESKASLRRCTQSLILVIVFLAFRDSFASDIWGDLSTSSLLLGLLLTVLLLVLTSGLVWLTASRLFQDRATRISAFFCASQKTLAAGAPMAGSILAASSGVSGMPDLSLFILPLVAYHALQLLMAGFLVPPFARMAAAPSAE